MVVGPGDSLAGYPTELSPDERWRLLLQILQQRYTNQAQGIRNNMDAAQASQYLNSTNLNFAGDRSAQALRELSMQGDLTRQQQSNNRYGWGLEQDIAQARNQTARMGNEELPSVFNFAKRGFGY